MAQARRAYTSAAHLQPFVLDSISSGAAPVKPLAKIPEAELRKARSEIMLKLLEIERTRCLSKKDEEERTEGLAGLLEGDDIFLARIEKGLDKYLNLMFGDYVRPQVYPEPPLLPYSHLNQNILNELNGLLKASIINPSAWSIRQNQYHVDSREGSHRIMVEFSTGPKVR